MRCVSSRTHSPATHISDANKLMHFSRVNSLVFLQGSTSQLHFISKQCPSIATQQLLISLYAIYETIVQPTMTLVQPTINEDNDIAVNLPPSFRQSWGKVGDSGVEVFIKDFLNPLLEIQPSRRFRGAVMLDSVFNFNSSVGSQVYPEGFGEVRDAASSEREGEVEAWRGERRLSRVAPIISRVDECCTHGGTGWVGGSLCPLE